MSQSTDCQISELLVDELPQYNQMQQSLQRQLYLSRQILAKFGLYDAQDWITQRMNYVTTMPTDEVIKDVTQ